MSHQHDELFSLAVKMLREKRHSSLEIESALESASTGAGDTQEVRSIIYQAQKFVTEADETAFACAIEAFKQGKSHFEVSQTLVKCKFHPYDAEAMASRAMAKAEQERKAETTKSL